MQKIIKTGPFPDCMVCGRPGAEKYGDLSDRFGLVKGRFILKECSSCGLLWLDPRPVSSAVMDCYDEYYAEEEAKNGVFISSKRFLGGFRDAFREGIICGYYGYRNFHNKHRFCGLYGFLGHVPLLRAKAIYELGGLFPFFNPDPGALFLDVGCGKGDFLDFLRNAGCPNLMGIEPHFVAAGLAEKRGLKVFKGTLEEAKLPDSSVAQVTMNHVVEHLLSPAFTLQECWRILKPGGKLVLRTPNVKSFGHKVFHKHWMALDPPRHIFIFSPLSLNILFGKLPFNKFSIKTITRSARNNYNASKSISEGNKDNLKNILPRKRRYFFAFMEWLGCRFGKDWGEDIELTAEK
ncbi:MAG: class I SAM-dependent methyltransferase [bacterium]